MILELLMLAALSDKDTKEQPTTDSKPTAGALLTFVLFVLAVVGCAYLKPSPKFPEGTKMCMVLNNELVCR